MLRAANRVTVPHATHGRGSSRSRGWPSVLASAHASAWLLVLLVAMLPRGALAHEGTQASGLALYLAATDAPAQAFWRATLRRVGLAWQEPRDAAALAALRPAIVILPHARRLSQAELDVLVRLQAHGAGLLATGALGLADDDGETSQAASRLFGGGRLRPLAAAVPAARERLVRDEGVTISGYGLTPLTLDLPAGSRVAFTPHAWLLSGATGASTAAEFTDWSYRPIDGGASGLPAVIYAELATPVRGTAQRARWVYVGMEGLDGDAAAFTTLVRDALAWLAQPRGSATFARARVADWPPGRRWAQLVEMDTELDSRHNPGKFESADALAAQMKQAGARASFYGVSGDLALAPGLVDRLSQDGHEIGLHGDVHDPFGKTPAGEQEQRIEAMLRAWRALRPANAPPPGFRAPYESYDGETQRLLAAAGIAYHVSDPNAAPGRLPYFAEAGPGRRLLNLPRTQPDDFAMLTRSRSVGQLRSWLDIDAASARRSGALALLSVHPQHFEPGSPMRAALPDLLAQLQRAGPTLWWARGQEIAQWWLQRDRVRLQPLPNGLQIELAPGPPLAGLAIVIDRDPRQRLVPRVEGSTARLEALLPWPAADAVAWQTELRLDDLPAGSTRLIWGRP